jgi:hypothetical protein
VNCDGGIDPESVSGGAGNDKLYGGGSAGVFDGGTGSDTFGVVYLPLLGPAMQLEVDLTAGYAAERAAPPTPRLRSAARRHFQAPARTRCRTATS